MFIFVGELLVVKYPRASQEAIYRGYLAKCSSLKNQQKGRYIKRKFIKEKYEKNQVEIRGNQYISKEAQ